MKKALIIASCGLLLALIISATTHTKASTEKNGGEHFFDAKCAEPTEEKPTHTPCVLRLNGDVYTDMFLRELKRKMRRAYA